MQGGGLRGKRRRLRAHFNHARLTASTSALVLIHPRAALSTRLQYYYVFGFLLLVFCLLIITCAEISIVLTYFHLCAGAWRRGAGAARGASRRTESEGCVRPITR